MPQVGLEHTIPMFERAETFCDLDRAPTDVNGKAVPVTGREGP
jgi:hypothetical protein